MVQHSQSNFWLAQKNTIQSWSPGEFLPLCVYFGHNRRIDVFLFLRVEDILPDSANSLIECPLCRIPGGAVNVRGLS